jgi:hypothetical protein
VESVCVAVLDPVVSASWPIKLAWEWREMPDSLETIHIRKTPRNSFGAGFLNVDYHE